MSPNLRRELWSAISVLIRNCGGDPKQIKGGWAVTTIAEIMSIHCLSKKGQVKWRARLAGHRR